MRLSGLSLRTTVFAAIVIAVFGPLAIWWSAQQTLLREAYEPIVAQNRQAVLGLTAAALIEPLWTIDERGTQAAVQSALADPAVLRVRLTEQRPTDRSEPIVRDLGRPHSEALRLHSTLTREGVVLGELEIWFDARQLDRLIEARRLESYKLAGLQVALGLLVLTVVFYRRLLRPIERLKAQASRIAQSPRGEVETPAWLQRDELGELGEHLSDVHRQIRTLFEQIERQQAALEKLALHDSLTGLPNRLLFRELAQSACAAALRDGGSVALLFIDLDRFKGVNDSLGHAAGDMLLKTVARRLEGAVRAADVVCRHSGDEFLVLLHEPGQLDQLVATVERIQQEVGRPLALEGRELQVAASIGIALLPEDARSPDELIRHADLAMYEAKKAGRAQHSFYRDELNQRAQVQARLERELREALARDEFVLHYQPQVDAGDGRLVGCEALIRWQHPQRGLVGPVEFIPVAEQAGLIGAIGEWVVRAACAQAARWKAAGFAFGSVAVNLSAAEFRDQRLVDTVRGAMQAHGLVADDLEIEITETVLMTDTGAPAIVAALQDLGLPLVVDDFGTGYSSLAYLKRLRPRTIKIDRSFLHGLPEDEEDRVVVQAILGIAGALGIAVVAEGVETIAQRDFLRDAGCPVLQGYWVSRPVPAADFEAWARARAPR